MVIGTLAGSGTLGLLIPPSIIMIVYGVAAEVSISKLFIAGVFPGILLSVLFSGYIIFWAWRYPDQIPKADSDPSLLEKLKASSSLVPVLLLIAAVLGSIYAGIAYRNRSGSFRRRGSAFAVALARLLNMGEL